MVLNQNAKREQGKTAQKANIQAAKAVSDIVRTTLGPKSMLKMLLDPMGGIVLTNYVASFRSFCALDAAFSISGALDCRQQMYDRRSEQVWQPLLAEWLRRTTMIGKWGHRLHARFTKPELVQIMRATSIVVSL